MKNVILIIVLSIMWYSCTNADATKIKEMPKPTKDYFKSLDELGFTGSPDVKHPAIDFLRKKYFAEYGLNFLSDDEVSLLTTTSGVVFSRAKNYLGKIPENAGRSIITNYAKIPDDKHYYHDDYFGDWYHIGLDRGGDKCKTEKGIYVLAKPEMFAVGADLHAGEDPLAMVKVDGGWLELARWK